MSTGLIDLIKLASVETFEATKPVEVIMGKVLEENPPKVVITDDLIITKEQMQSLGDLKKDAIVIVMRQQGGQKYLVIGDRTEVIDTTQIIDGGVMKT